MTNLDWAKLAIRLTGLWLMISSVTSVANLATLLGRPAVTGIFFSLLYPLVEGLIALLIWTKSDWLASCIFPTVVADHNLLAHSPQERLFVLALSIIGVVLVAQAMPALAYNVALFAISRSSSYSSVFGPIGYQAGEQARIWGAAAKASTLAAFVRGLIGCGLLAGPIRVSDLLATLRGRQELRD